MTTTHQDGDPWTARLESGAALTLRPAAEVRALAVHEGRVWATRRVDRGRAEDLWLAAGERLVLPPGSEWVIEAWPAARVSLLAALPGPELRAGGRAAVASWRAWLAALPRRSVRARSLPSLTA
ncbi:MAG: DUF2917 domain-containing protein [Rubrivivax sp.]|nr:DUF2917 domain-containing protein [Rubrivivax sp.]